MNLYEQSEATAARRRWLFVCVDDTDGKTPETSLTFSTGELQVSKNGAAFANAAGSATELSDGAYYYEATQGELDTVGVIGFKIEKSGVRTTIMQVGQVVPWDPYASNLPAQVKGMDAGVVTASAIASNAITDAKIASDAITSAKIADGTLTHPKFAEDVMIALGHLVMYGSASTAQAATSTTITLPSIAQSADDFYNGFYILIGGGTGFGQLRRITDYVGSTKVATVDSAWATTPDTDSVCIIFASPPSTADIDAALTASHGSGSWGSSPIASGTAQAGGASTITLASGASSTNDLYIDAVIKITGGTGAGQVNQITDYVGSSKVATVARAWATQPDSSSTYELLPAASPTAMADMTIEGRNVEGSYPLGDMVRGMFAALLGKLAGLDAVRAAGGTGDITFKAIDGSTTRITVTMSTDGRTAVTLTTLAA